MLNQKLPLEGLCLLGILLSLNFSSCKSDYGKFESEQKQITVEKAIQIDSVWVNFPDSVKRYNKKTKKQIDKVFYQRQAVYKVANQPAFFPGCPTYPNLQKKYDCSNKEFMQYIASNLEYPKEAFDKNIQGTSVARFIVDENGVPLKEEITKSIGYGTDEAVLAVIRKMRDNNIKWEPGIVKNKPVKVFHSIPVRFAMQ